MKQQVEARCEEMEAEASFLKNGNSEGDNVHNKRIAALKMRYDYKARKLERDRGVLLGGFAHAMSLLRVGKGLQPSAKNLYNETYRRLGNCEEAWSRLLGGL